MQGMRTQMSSIASLLSNRVFVSRLWLMARLAFPNERMLEGLIHAVSVRL